MYISDYIFLDLQTLLAHDSFLKEKKTNLFDTLEEENNTLRWYKIAAHAISNIGVDDVSVVMGEAIDPCFRSPSFSQWVLGLLGLQIPAFDFITGGTFLSFLGKFKPQFDSFLYVGLGVLQRESRFESGLVALKLNSSGGYFKVTDGEIFYTEKILGFKNSCFEDAEFIYTSPSEKTLSLIKNKSDRYRSILPWFMDSGRGDKAFMLNDGAIQLLKSAQSFESGTKIKVVEVGLNGVMGFATVEVC